MSPMPRRTSSRAVSSSTGANTSPRKLSARRRKYHLWIGLIMNQAELSSLRLTFRHETGHLVVGKSLSFPTGELTFNNDQAGQSVDLHPKIKSIADMTKFAEDRIT